MSDAAQVNLRGVSCVYDGRVNFSTERAMKATVLVLAAAAALVAGTANADTAELKAKGCLGCHDMDKKKAGPAFKDIAAKYKGDKDAEEMLTAKITSGKGHPKSKASEEEVKKLVKDVLAGK